MHIPTRKLGAPMSIPVSYTHLDVYKRQVWPIGIVMQALTSDSREEILSCLDMLSKTHAGTNFMHESFDPNRPENFTREWFAWANTLFAQLLNTLMDNHFFN